jgi:hypothetical protein
VERLFVALPALVAAIDTQPAAQAELRQRDDRLVLAYDAPNWQPARPAAGRETTSCSRPPSEPWSSPPPPR